MINKTRINEFNKLLKEANLTIVAAESITAGLLASSIASVSGASSVLKGSIVTYNTDMKMSLLRVNPSTLEKYTAESLETTREMVNGLRQLYPASSVYVAVTGVASKGTPEYPVRAKVGQIFVCFWFKNKFYSFKRQMRSREREVIREMAVEFILDQLTKLIRKPVAEVAK